MSLTLPVPIVPGSLYHGCFVGPQASHVPDSLNDPEGVESQRSPYHPSGLFVGAFSYSRNHTPQQKSWGSYESLGDLREQEARGR